MVRAGDGVAVGAEFQEAQVKHLAGLVEGLVGLDGDAAGGGVREIDRGVLAEVAECAGDAEVGVRAGGEVEGGQTVLAGDGVLVFGIDADAGDGGGGDGMGAGGDDLQAGGGGRQGGQNDVEVEGVGGQVGVAEDAVVGLEGRKVSAAGGEAVAEAEQERLLLLRQRQGYGHGGGAGGDGDFAGGLGEGLAVRGEPGELDPAVDRLGLMALDGDGDGGFAVGELGAGGGLDHGDLGERGQGHQCEYR